MDKNNQDTVLYVSIQSSYTEFEIALFKGDACLEVVAQDRLHASSHFLLFLEQLLQKHDVVFQDLSFIAVDQGPGAFTSLRVMISTLNALAFETGVKLVGVDGLDALAYQVSEAVEMSALEEKTLLISLLNAYNNEAYYGVYCFRNGLLELCFPKGYKNVKILFDELIERYSDYTFVFTGNGVAVYESLIKDMFDDLRLGTLAFRSVCSALQIGKMGLDQWTKGVNVCTELFPLYLKTQTFAIKK